MLSEPLASRFGASQRSSQTSSHGDGDPATRRACGLSNWSPTSGLGEDRRFSAVRLASAGWDATSSPRLSRYRQVGGCDVPGLRKALRAAM